MRLINICPYCESQQVIENYATHLGKKAVIKGQCHKCGNHFEETWTLTKLQKIIPGQADKELEALRAKEAKAKQKGKEKIE